MFSTADAEDISQVSLQSCDRNEQESPQNTQVVKQNNRRDITVNMLIKELVFCIALALTTYGAFHNSPTKISKHPYPVRFFAEDSVVTDSYTGQLRYMLNIVNKEDLSFVMYYAPWDAESQHVRGEFEKAASILSDRVYFAAINCWNPGSECRLQHNKIPSWPILMAYTVTSKNIIYKGPHDVYSMVKFLELLMRPFERISSSEDLVTMLSTCDVLAVGYTPFTETTKHYAVWYNVALKAKEFDVIGEICFAIVTSESLSNELGLQNLPNARLVLWNTTKEYNKSYEAMPWSETELTKWIFENFRQPVARIIPLWQKSSNFDRYADGNPILILFTPLNPLYEMLPAFDLLREVAMEYYNCKKNRQWVSAVIKLQQVQRLMYQQRNIEKYCKKFESEMKVSKPKVYNKKPIISQNNKYPWINNTEKLQKSGLINSLMNSGFSLSKLMGSNDDEALILSMMEECGSKVLPADKSFYETCQQCQSFEGFFENYKSDVDNVPEPTWTEESDPLSSDNLIEKDLRHYCNLFSFAKEHSPQVKLPNIPYTDIPSISGLACEKNFSLHILAIDSVVNHHFAEALGIDIMKKEYSTAVVILDSKQESEYILSEPYSAKSIREFIRNFTEKTLKRSFRSHLFDASYTHFFSSGGTVEDSVAGTENIFITDLTSRTFKEMVRSTGKISLIAICGGICSASVSRALSEATRILSSCDIKVEAARLDALRHDLPWQYTTPSYPAIVVLSYDGDREADSQTYPISERITGSGLVSMSLRSMGTPFYLRVRLVLCSKTKVIEEKRICLKEMKELITKLIGRNLKYWRETQSKQLKDALLQRLQQLHRISLELSVLHVSDLTEQSPKQKSLLQLLSILSNTWEKYVTSIMKSMAASLS